jgi:Flp pilus assembly protein TadG
MCSFIRKHHHYLRFLLSSFNRRSAPLHFGPEAARAPTARGFLGDRSGVVVILVALAMPVLAGTMGLAAETSYWYMHQRSMQNAADAAAIAAATAGTVNGSSAYQPEAKGVAAQFGFTNGAGNITVTATNPSTAANCTSGCYTVTVQDKVPLFLWKVIHYRGTNNSGLTTLSVSSVATVWGGAYCIVALNDNVTQDTNGAPKADLAGCNIMANAGAAIR